MVTASIALVLTIVVGVLFWSGKLPLLGMIVSLLCGASLASLLLPVVNLLGTAAQSVATMFEAVAK